MVIQEVGTVLDTFVHYIYIGLVKGGGKDTVLIGKPC